MNFIAYAHLIPVVDGGVRIVVSSNGKLKKANWGAHIVGPSRKCLACLEQYDPGMVAVERDGLLDDPKYIEGLPPDSIFRRNENVFAFNLSVASMEILQFLLMIVAPHGIGSNGAMRFSFVTASLNQDFGGCERNCIFPTLTGMGDRTGMSLTARHPLAEKVRKSRKSVR